MPPISIFSAFGGTGRGGAGTGGFISSSIGSRYASALLGNQVAINVFLLGDGVAVAKRNQKTPTGYYNTASMLSELIAKGVKVKT